MLYLRITIVILFFFIFTACSDQKKEKKETKKVSEIEDKKPEIDSLEIAHLDLIAKNKNEITERLFYFFREEFAGLKSSNNSNVVLKESISFNKFSVQYDLIMAKKNYNQQYKPQKLSAGLAFNETEVNNEVNADTIKIISDIKLVDAPLNPEAKIEILKINIEGELYSSTYFESPYGGSEHQEFMDNFEEPLIVNLKKPDFPNRDELYLIARYKILTEKDIDHLSKEEMAFLRNEIFARHGHVFKTDRMKDYFSEKEWYFPLIYDATDNLNAIEKENVSFILQMES